MLTHRGGEQTREDLKELVDADRFGKVPMKPFSLRALSIAG